MNNIDLIKKLNSKIFHDLGNIVIMLSMLDDSSSEDSVKSDMVSDIIDRFKVLKNAFAQVDSDTSLLTSYDLLTKYFSNKKITLQEIRNSVDQEYSPDQCQLFINVVMCLAAAISCCGEIKINLSDTGFFVEANGNNVVKPLIGEVLSSKDVNYNSGNNSIQACFTSLLAQNLKAKIKFFCKHKCLFLQVLF